jgi:16S rRNA (uracil1498-N3)-methyltransferase
MQIAATPKTRLYSADELIENSELWLTGEQAKYVTRVLRLKADDTILMFDGNGGQYSAEVRSFARNRVLLHIGDRQARDVESPLAIHLIQGLSRGGRMDVVIQKSTELGVRRISPVITQYSVVRLDSGRAASRHEHWRKISQSACEQCGRNILPQIGMPQTLSDWLDCNPGKRSTRILLDPQSSESMATMQKPDSDVELLIGPEGGLSEAERTRCEESGFRAVSLGPRILRTETAALAGIAVLQASWGDLNRIPENQA